MEKVIYTAIFGPYDELKEPLYVTPGWRYICYTDQPFKSKVWEIRPIKDFTNNGPQHSARWFKLMFHECILAPLSIWVDGSFTINTDLNKFVETRHKGQFSCAKHPIRNDVFDEGRACINNKRGPRDPILKQITSYIGRVPRKNGLITSGILIRNRTPEVIELCEKWWEELSNKSNRDQISFALVSMGYEHLIHTYDWDYRTAKDFIFKTHIHRR